MRLMISLVIAVGFGNLADGQEGEGAQPYPKSGAVWSSNSDEAHGEAAGLNAPLLVVFHADGSEADEKMASVYRDPRFVEASRTWVLLVAHPGTSHEIEVEIEGKKVKRCSRYFNITCQDHDAVDRRLRSIHKIEKTTPMRLVFHHDGTVWKELARESGPTTVQSLVKTMEKIYGSIPGEKVTREELSKAKAKDAEGKEAISKKEWQKAIKIYTEMSKLPKARLRSYAETGLFEVNMEGESLFWDAYKNWVKTRMSDEAGKVLQKILSDFKPLKVSVKAQQALDEKKMKR